MTKDVYFTIPRLQRITQQILVALQFVHSLDMIHCDLKPENILIKSYSQVQVKVIDFGSSCFVTDQLSSYLQSRSYRAPEVILGHTYDQKIDMWSLGCILAELYTGRVLFQNDSLASLLAKQIGILGTNKAERLFLRRAPLRDDYFADGLLTEVRGMVPIYICPKKSTLARRLGTTDELFISFLKSLLRMIPKDRLSAAEALKHPWLAHHYEDSDESDG